LTEIALFLDPSEWDDRQSDQCAGAATEPTSAPRAESRSLAACPTQAAHDVVIDLEAEAISGGVPMPKIERYRFGHIVVDGEERIHDLIVLPGRVALHLTG
jgi:hypothetical protein